MGEVVFVELHFSPGNAILTRYNLLFVVAPDKDVRHRHDLLVTCSHFETFGIWKYLA